MAQSTVYPRQRAKPLFTTALPAARIAAGLTQVELAQRARVGRASLAAAETNPGRRFRMLLAGRLALAIDDLFTAEAPAQDPAPPATGARYPREQRKKLPFPFPSGPLGPV